MFVFYVTRLRCILIRLICYVRGNICPSTPYFFLLQLAMHSYVFIRYETSLVTVLGDLLLPSSLPEVRMLAAIRNGETSLWVSGLVFTLRQSCFAYKLQTAP